MAIRNNINFRKALVQCHRFLALFVVFDAPPLQELPLIDRSVTAGETAHTLLWRSVQALNSTATGTPDA